MAPASTCALELLRLFRARHDDWLFEYATFDRKTQLTLGGFRWSVTRRIAVSDIGISSGISMGLMQRPNAAERRHIRHSGWMRLRQAMRGAGFEDDSVLNAELQHGFWVRPLVDPKEAPAEWAFLNRLRLQDAVRGWSFPVRAPASTRFWDRTRVRGNAEKLFAKVPRNRVLWTNLTKSEFVRDFEAAHEGKRWRVTIQFAGASDSFSSIVQFVPLNARRALPKNLPGSFDFVRQTMLTRGYEELQPGVFQRRFGGFDEARREKDFLSAVGLVPPSTPERSRSEGRTARKRQQRPRS